MSKTRTLAYRALLTDTLPYEVPIVFSNDKFHAALSSRVDPALQTALDRLLTKQGDTFTIPYNYSIAKPGGGTTVLSIVHPHYQRAIAEFYEAHHNSLLNFCSDGRFSLRRPTAIASPFVEGTVSSDDSKHKSGVVQKLAAAGEPDVSHLTSYFAYGRYTLLGKFVGSKEFIGLESRFMHLRQLDVSKCFYHIYTHSVTWAVKTKAYAKLNKGSYSFEAELDALMQRSNYNETNGIVVGPEFSRIFAEIILQAIDREIASDLRAVGLVLGHDFEIRRYVDDCFVFSNSLVTLDRVEQVIRRVLNGYKLYLNDKKIQTHSRPFVSNLTQVRRDLSNEVQTLHRVLSEIEKTQPVSIDGRSVDAVRNGLRSFRLLLKRHDADFGHVSGWLLMKLRKLAARSLKLTPTLANEVDRRRVFEIVVSILEAALYICAVDLRVRTTYSLAQIALLMKKNQAAFPADVWELVDAVVAREIYSILDAVAANTDDEFIRRESVELYNLLIIGAEFVGVDFLRAASTRRVLSLLRRKTELNYFAYITLKFCFFKDQAMFQCELDELNQRAVALVRQKGKEVFRESEAFLFLSDLVSDARLQVAVRRELLQDVIGGKPSNKLADDLSEYVGHADWDGLSVEHLLRRKELRPVYSWS